LTESYQAIMDMMKETSTYLFFDDKVSDNLDDEKRALLVETLKFLIDAAFALDRKSVSCRYLEKYLELNPSLGNKWKLLGDTYLELYESKKALKAYRRGVGNDPANESIWQSLKKLYSSSNLNEEAELCEKSLNESSISVKSEIALELLLLGRDQFSQRYAVNHLLDLNPEDPTALKMEAKCWLIHHGFHIAKTSLEKAMTINPNDQDILWTYIRTLCKANELEEAREQLMGYMKKFPDTIDSKNLLHEVEKRIKSEDQYGRENVSFVFFISIRHEKKRSQTSMPLGTTVLEAAYNYLWSPGVEVRQDKFYLAKRINMQAFDVSDLKFQFSDPRGEPLQFERSMPAGLNDIVLHGDVIWVSERSV
ncbi:MAG: tetratricopeptide repeat protein, partial [Candidatus Thorarchaeota archaeon]